MPTKPPFLVHLVFHPASLSARRLAEAIHTALFEDPAVPGLAIPSVICREDGTGLPPIDHRLDEAEHSAVVLLADPELALERDDPPAGRSDWRDFAASLFRACDGSTHRFIPFQLDEHAFGFHPDLTKVNFARAWAQPEPERTTWVVRRLVIELCRFMLRMERGDKAPLRVFLSHAKADIEHEPKVFKALVEHLAITQPVEAWVDSAQIEAGSQFEEAIKHGAEDSAILAIVTDTFGARPYCKWEVLLAKEKQRPLIAVTALDKLDVRAFPYLGNIPVLPWRPGHAAEAVTLLLKEQLRQAHAVRTLERVRAPGDTIFPSPPELATVLAVPIGGTALYPDPPLDDGERALIERTGRRSATPLSRLHGARPIPGRRVSLSVSESGDSERFGTLPMHLDEITLEMSRHLLVAGATLAYGGHLGSAGYTEALFNLRAAHAASAPGLATDRIRNYVGWPLPYQTMDATKRLRYQHHLRFIRVPRPDGVADLEPTTFVDEPAYFPPSTPARRYAWARGMTALRERQTADTQARIIIGGKLGPTLHAQPDGTVDTKWYASRIPGLLEEALISLRAGDDHRVYLLGAYGGAAAAVAQLLDGEDRPDLDWSVHCQAPHAGGMRELYDQRGVPFEDYPAMKRWLRAFGVVGLSRRNYLTPAENRELFWTRDVPRAIELVLLGLGRDASPA
ncbi:MAG: TIR domain-containing protein [Kofleriaceae bacterium]|nr:TIR domain-containing protein [Kofleriaceae bacterium]MBP9168193.1 TIR domain-containing protein [Kofleriaceae bacterium]MBP9856429.1 TIR domain-containing protein [Kofleriaceae bacterium]